jgi:hypothetical protein
LVAQPVSATARANAETIAKLRVFIFFSFFICDGCGSLVGLKLSLDPPSPSGQVSSKIFWLRLAPVPLPAGDCALKMVQLSGGGNWTLVQ